MNVLAHCLRRRFTKAHSSICVSGLFTSFQFWQWYLKELLEEENQAIKMLDELKVIGENRSAIYSCDKDILRIREKVCKETAKELSQE
jgi:hypothetical protein